MSGAPPTVELRLPNPHPPYVKKTPWGIVAQQSTGGAQDMRPRPCHSQTMGLTSPTDPVALSLPKVELQLLKLPLPLDGVWSIL